MCARREMVHFGSLEPLLTLHNLRSLIIKITKGFYFSSPMEIKRIATSFPKVETLKLNQSAYSRSDEPSPITVVDLFPFADHCPHLQSLGITFDATSPPEIIRQNVFWDRMSKTILTDLYVGDSHIKDPALFAATLSGVFPL
ncbi:hypothetical protein BDQ17DRAFT_901134 [Cyathus striatus]|nr:hypothetical protein BDQ17DRAFT_901134 [Cyathus striatus]